MEFVVEHEEQREADDRQDSNNEEQDDQAEGGQDVDEDAHDVTVLEWGVIETVPVVSEAHHTSPGRQPG